MKLHKEVLIPFLILLVLAFTGRAVVSKEMIKPGPAAERLVGLAYSTWFPPISWDKIWSEPELGKYRSNDRAVIKKHAQWISDAGVDFIWIDWSNNIEYDPTLKDCEPVMKDGKVFLRYRQDIADIESATHVVFEEYSKLQKHPKISIFIGCPDTPEAVKDGRLQRKADQIYNTYVKDPRFGPLMQRYLGKPLLAVYVGTPSPFHNGIPDWDDKRFTVRYMTGFVTQQPNLITPDLVSKYGYWSWEDRGKQTYTLCEGKPEAMTVVACWRDDPACPTPGRRSGQTFREQWARARETGVRIAMVVSWNEWSTSEQPSAEVSKDIEPSEAFGHLYLDILKEEIARFRQKDVKQ